MLAMMAICIFIFMVVHMRRRGPLEKTWVVGLLSYFSLGRGWGNLALKVSASPNYSCWPAG